MKEKNPFVEPLTPDELRAAQEQANATLETRSSKDFDHEVAKIREAWEKFCDGAPKNPGAARDAFMAETASLRKNAQFYTDFLHQLLPFFLETWALEFLNIPPELQRKTIKKGSILVHYSPGMSEVEAPLLQFSLPMAEEDSLISNLGNLGDFLIDAYQKATDHWLQSPDGNFKVILVMGHVMEGLYGMPGTPQDLPTSSKLQSILGEVSKRMKQGIAAGISDMAAFTKGIVASYFEQEGELISLETHLEIIERNKSLLQALSKLGEGTNITDHLSVGCPYSNPYLLAKDEQGKYYLTIEKRVMVILETYTQLRQQVFAGELGPEDFKGKLKQQMELCYSEFPENIIDELVEKIARKCWDNEGVLIPARGSYGCPTRRARVTMPDKSYPPASPGESLIFPTYNYFMKIFAYATAYQFSQHSKSVFSNEDPEMLRALNRLSGR